MKSRATGRNAVKLSSDMLKLFCPWLRSSSDYLPDRTPGRRGNTEDLLLLRGELSFFNFKGGYGQAVHAPCHESTIIKPSNLSVSHSKKKKKKQRGVLRRRESRS